MEDQPWTSVDLIIFSASKPILTKSYKQNSLSGNMAYDIIPTQTAGGLNITSKNASDMSLTNFGK